MLRGRNNEQGHPEETGAVWREEGSAGEGRTPGGSHLDAPRLWRRVRRRTPPRALGFGFVTRLTRRCWQTGGESPRAWKVTVGALRRCNGASAKLATSVGLGLRTTHEFLPARTAHAGNRRSGQNKWHRPLKPCGSDLPAHPRHTCGRRPGRRRRGVPAAVASDGESRQRAGGMKPEGGRDER